MEARDVPFEPVDNADCELRVAKHNFQCQIVKRIRFNINIESGLQVE